MTESEAKGFIQGKLDCMSKCGIFNKEDNTSVNDCDNCEYCYSQGNFGQQKEAFQMAINALEKQLVKKPKNRYKTRYIWDSAYCPVCNCGITARWGYCQCCGQKLDWSDEE